MILADAHVHIYPCYDMAMFLRHARANFAAAARGAGAKRAFAGVLLLTESRGHDRFAELSRGVGTSVRWGGWQSDATQEPHSLRLRNGTEEMFVVAGRQVATAQDLEVLTLGTTTVVPDGKPIAEVLARALELGVVHVIPWGAGKWWFGRGRLLDGIIRDAASADFFLGDESARPGFWATPRQFGEAAARGIRVLPGTDPLPFPHEVSRAGRFGFRLDAAIDPERPAASLQRLLRDRMLAIQPFGELESPVTFVRHQVALQIRKRLLRPA